MVELDIDESGQSMNISLIEEAVELYGVGPKPFYLLLDEMNDSVISPNIKQHKVWERTETELVKTLVSEGDCVIDIGAHIGYVTVLFSLLVGEKGCVYGFEPELHNYSLLQKNISINQLQNVVIENKAVSNRSYAGDLYLSKHNKGDHRLAPTHNRAVQRVDCISLEEYLSDSAHSIDFIKCDTQGAELEILFGMTKLIEQNKNHLCCLMEFSSGLLNTKDPEGTAQFIDFFDSYQAKIYWIKDNGANSQLVFMDKDTLRDIATKMIKHEDEDCFCNLLIFFSANAQVKYFRKLGW